MAVEIRTPTADEVAEIARVDGISFGVVWKPDEVDRLREVLEPDRFRVADDSGAVVGVAGSFGLQMTLPGGAAVPTGGVTWVSVLVTHRRRGVLRRLLGAVHADIDDRGEPLAALGASEASIYERFGYGIASRERLVEIDRRRAVLRSDLPAGGPVRLVAPGDVVAAVSERWERYRTVRPGEVARSEAWHRKAVADRGAEVVYAVHADGYAAWKTTAHGSLGLPANRLELLELVAITPDAHLDLWRTVLGMDLVETITSTALPLDDPLPYLLVDPRVVRTRDLNDAVWLSVRDVATCFGSRTYGTDDEIVIEADGVRWRIGAGGCRRVRSRPDLVGGGAALSALLLGGVRPSELVAGRRLEARSTAAARRADALFATAPLPHCMTEF